MSRPWTPPKRPGEKADIARAGKKGKIRPEDIRVKAEVRTDVGRTAANHVPGGG